MKLCEVDVLGTKYSVYVVKKGENKASDAIFGKGSDAYCEFSTKEIILQDIDPADCDKPANTEAYLMECMRHEILHAFLYESGLDASAAPSECWATNEEMVDWFAIQSPKLYKAYKEADCLCA